ncbi:MAG TPA: sugar transferase [Gemmatimonadaceae bacterium]|jgi:exopolysaccharide biosynthesis polyprenyl glycosylphosphotransferase
MLVAVTIGVFLTRGYSRQTRSSANVNLLRGSVLASLLVTAAAWPAASGVTALVLPFLVCFASVGVPLATGRAAARRLLNAVFTDSRWAIPAALVGFGNASTVPGEEEFAPVDREYRVVAHVDVDRGPLHPGSLHELGNVIAHRAVEAVVVSGDLVNEEMEAVLDLCLTGGCELLYPASAVRIANVRPALVWRGDRPFFELGAPVLKAQQLFVKRCVDIVGASIALVCAAPIVAIIMIAVRLDSPGPIFFGQDRAGLGGRRFRMLKFRTMRVGADAEKEMLAHLNVTGDVRLFKIPNDPRVTRLGVFLRRWSLDELPQFWNVVRGDMSLIGPRPCLEAEVDAYEADHFRRLGAKPGITGLWQVSGRSSIRDFEEVNRLDRRYIEQWSLWLDMSILLRTFPAVFGRHGAY